MQVTCDYCGKMYKVDENKIKGEKARLKCRSCEHIIIVTKPDPEAAAEAPMPEPKPAPAAAARPPRPVAADKVQEPVIEEPPADADLGKRKVRFGLFTKIIVVMLIVSLLPLIIFWSITYKETVARIQNDTEQLFTLTAQGLGNEVDNWIENNIWVLRSAAELPAIKSMNRENQEPILREIHKKHPYMYLVFTVGLDGRNVARSDDVPLKDYSDRQYYKDIIRGKQLAWQTLIGKTSKKPALVISLPVTRGGQLVGVMAGAMTIDDISRYIARWKKGDTGFAFLIDEKGKVVAHQVKDYVVTQKNLSRYPLISAFRKGNWTTHTTRFEDDNGSSSYGHVRKIKRGWAIALQQQEAEVFAPLKRVQNFAIILLVATVVIVSLIAWISARAIVTPITRLTDVAERMSLGDLNMQINIPSKDEIGLLAQAIKRMQTSLRLAMERLRRKK
jgi:methyl-accepting chemotaxis protein